MHNTNEEKRVGTVIHVYTRIYTYIHVGTVIQVIQGERCLKLQDNNTVRLSSHLGRSTYDELMVTCMVYILV